VRGRLRQGAGCKAQFHSARAGATRGRKCGRGLWFGLTQLRVSGASRVCAWIGTFPGCVVVWAAYRVGTVRTVLSSSDGGARRRGARSMYQAG
jgi:hypothetical protein